MADDGPSSDGLPLELFRLIVEQSGDGIIVSDENGVLRIFNPEAERQHGVKKREVSAPEWAQTYGLFTLDGAQLPLQETPLFRAVKGETVVAARWIVRLPDGTERILTGTATPLRRPDGSPAGAVLITRDETERHVHERERAEMLKRERIARETSDRERELALTFAAEVTAQMQAAERALAETQARCIELEKRLAGQ